MTEKTNTPETEKTLQQMTFLEYWNFLRSDDFDEFKKFKKALCDLLGVTDDTLRFRKRDIRLFSNPERICISAFISQYENNPEITLSTLFPSIE